MSTRKKSGGSLAHDVKNLAVPFSLLLGKNLLEGYMDKKKKTNNAKGGANNNNAKRGNSGQVANNSAYNVFSQSQTTQDGGRRTLRKTSNKSRKNN
jgi:hypothetical protein